MQQKREGRILFPLFGSFGTWPEKKKYINRIMGELIRNDDFYLTEVMGQSIDIVDMCGEIVFGLELNRDLGVMMGGYPTDPSVDDHMVRLESIKWSEEDNEFISSTDDIKYKRGMRDVGTMALGSHVIRNSSHVIREDNILTLRSPCTVDLKRAWIVLKEKGMFVKSATRPDSQHNRWLAREIPADEPAPKKRGRPPKTAEQATV